MLHVVSTTHNTIYADTRAYRVITSNTIVRIIFMRGRSCWKQPRWEGRREMLSFLSYFHEHQGY